MKQNNQALVNDLQDQNQKAAELAHIWLKLNPEVLQYKPSSEEWSVLECVEHLNRYHRFYLPQLQKIAAQQGSNHTEHTFKPSWLGQFIVQLIEPKQGKIKKMKAVKSMNPIGQSLSIAVLHEFVQNQTELNKILGQLATVPWANQKLATVMSKYIHLNLGNTLRFITAHNERHLLQAQNRLKATHELSV